MKNDIIRIPEPWDKHLDRLTFTEQEFAIAGTENLSGSFIRRPESPTWKKQKKNTDNQKK